MNLVDTQSAPKVIKTWDERRDEEQFIESGVDDEVGTSFLASTQGHSSYHLVYHLLADSPAHPLHPIHRLVAPAHAAPTPSPAVAPAPSPPPEDIPQSSQRAGFQRRRGHDPRHGH